jgi:hypothetical protein
LPNPAAQLNPQVPDVQYGVPFAAPHTVVHDPQCDTFPDRLCSQPSDALPLQSPHPDAHDATWHAPVAQVAVPFATAQATPQPPQFVVVVSAVSQPFAGLPSQSPQPASQAAMPHVVPVHEGVPWATVHTMPQPPHAAGLFVVGVSHPSATLALQSANPALQAMPQAPFVHDAVPWLPLQAWPHAPQFDRFVDVAVSQPFATLPSQSPKPAAHAIEHLPEAQLGVPFVALHAAPHAPQLATDDEVSVSQPFERLPSQFW